MCAHIYVCGCVKNLHTRSKNKHSKGMSVCVCEQMEHLSGKHEGHEKKKKLLNAFEYIKYKGG